MSEQKSYTQLDVLRPAQALNWLKLTKLKALTTPSLPNGILNMSDDNYAKNQCGHNLVLFIPTKILR